METMLHKVIVYNYLYRFNEVENKLKDKFEGELKKCEGTVKNRFNFLHLSEEIRSRLEINMESNQFVIQRMRYNCEGDNSVKWSLSKRIAFAEKNNLMSDVFSEDISHLENKRVDLNFKKIIVEAIKIRNILAHERDGSTIEPSFERLSDKRLIELVEQDSQFNESSGLENLGDKYKHVLTYYFHLNIIDELIS